MKKASFWKDGLSVKESKFSIIGVLLITGILYALFSHHSDGDITANLLDLVKALLMAFVGMNGVDRVSSVFDKKYESNEQNGGI